MNKEAYIRLLAEIRHKIREAQVKTVMAANSQLLLLYWQIGKYILTNQNQLGWGSKVISLLAEDLKREFPDLKGFSTRNLKYMRAFANDYTPSVIEKMAALEASFKPNKDFVQQAVAQIEDIRSQSFIKVQQLAAQFEESQFLTSVLARIT